MEIKDIPAIGISLGIAVVIIVVMSLITTEIRDFTTDATASFGNQSLTWAGNNTAISFSESRVSTGTVILYNNGTVVNRGSGESANYTVTESAITITNSSPLWNGTNTTTQWVTGALNASFDYKFGSSARNTTINGLSGQNTFASFLPLVALAAIGAVIVGIVLAFFMRRK